MIKSENLGQQHTDRRAVTSISPQAELKTIQDIGLVILISNFIITYRINDQIHENKTHIVINRIIL